MGKIRLYTPDEHFTIDQIEIIIDEFRRRIKYDTEMNAIVVDFYDVDREKVLAYQFYGLVTSDEIAKKVREAREAIFVDSDRHHTITMEMKHDPDQEQKRGWYPGKLIMNALGRDKSGYEVFELRPDIQARLGSFFRSMFSFSACGLPESHADTRTIDDRIQAYRGSCVSRGMTGEKLENAVAMYAARLYSTSARLRFQATTPVAVLMYRDSLERQGLPQDEIDARVKSYRAAMIGSAEKFHDSSMPDPYADVEPVPGRGYATYWAPRR